MTMKACSMVLVSACTTLLLVFAWSGMGSTSGVLVAAGAGVRLSSADSQANATARQGTVSWVLRWNQIAIDASGLDHMPPQPGENRVFGEQMGPGRSSRAMAIVHIAIFEAINAVTRQYQSYVGFPPLRRGGVYLEAAIAQAAHDTLRALFPAQSDRFAAQLADDLGRIPGGSAKETGIVLGRDTAEAILSRAARDGSQHPESRVGIEFIASSDPGMWRADPVSQSPVAMGAHWGEVTPFVLRSPSQFRVPPPPSLDSDAYAAAFDEVKALGGDGIVTPTVRTEDETHAGIYWAYDGTPSLCAPPRLYNQITVLIANQMGSNAIEIARLLALVNVAMSDAGVAIWESKYYYQVWRPVTGIREASEGSGPSRLGDGNPTTLGDPTFTPLGAPASNLTGPNFTPPFPAYPSGHAGFGGALFQILRRFYGTDDIAFTFVSDEYDGVTRDRTGAARPRLPRTFQRLSQAEEENGQSRIYLGIHWAFDKTEGIAQGRRIADYVFDSAFQPF